MAALNTENPISKMVTLFSMLRYTNEEDPIAVYFASQAEAKVATAFGPVSSTGSRSYSHKTETTYGSLVMNPPFVEPYLFFSGHCEEALRVYESVLKARIEFMMRFSESPEPMEGLPPNFEEKIMHASLMIGDSRIMACDGPESTGTFSGVALSVSLPTEEQVRSAFEALSQGGSVQMPLQETFWSPMFGMLTDRFGVPWMLTVTGEAPV